MIQAKRYRSALLEGVRQLPGVEAAGIASTTPFGGVNSDNVILAEGYHMAPNESVISVRHVSVSDGYFATIGARLIAGRWFDQGDVDGGRRVIIIDDGWRGSSSPTARPSDAGCGG